MENELLSCENRLRAMIISDKQNTPQRINKVLKSEIIFVLKNYFDTTSEDVDVDIQIDEFGKYNIFINAEARGIKVARVFGN